MRLKLGPLDLLEVECPDGSVYDVAAMTGRLAVRKHARPAGERLLVKCPHPADCREGDVTCVCVKAVTQGNRR